MRNSLPKIRKGHWGSVFDCAGHAIEGRPWPPAIRESRELREREERMERILKEIALKDANVAKAIRHAGLV